MFPWPVGQVQIFETDWLIIFSVVPVIHDTEIQGQGADFTGLGSSPIHNWNRARVRPSAPAFTQTIR